MRVEKKARVGQRRRRRKIMVNFEEWEHHMSVQYGKLLIAEIAFDMELKKQALKLARKRKPGDYIK